MKHAKAFLFPIEVEESFGLVLIEAGIVGTPVIAFNRGAIPEIIEHGITGFYGNNIDELVGFTKRSSEINPEVCRERVKKRFNNDIMVENYLKLYRTISAQIPLSNMNKRSSQSFHQGNMLMTSGRGRD